MCPYGVCGRGHVDVQPAARELEAQVRQDEQPRARRLRVVAVLGTSYCVVILNIVFVLSAIECILVSYWLILIIIKNRI